MRIKELTKQEAREQAKSWGARLPRKQYQVLHVVSRLEKSIQSVNTPDFIECDIVGRYWLGVSELNY